MAIRTISDAGGNWASTTTWVEGVLPGVNDDIVATATSGNLVLSTSEVVINSIDFTNYVATFTWNNRIMIGNGQSSLGLTSSLILSSTMGFTSSYTNWNLGFNNQKAGATNYIKTFGKIIPAVYTGNYAGAPFIKIEILDELNVNKFWSGNYFTPAQINGATISIVGTGEFHGGNGGVFYGTSPIVLKGTTTVNFDCGMSNKLIIDTLGTITINNLVIGAKSYSIPLNNPCDFTYIKGNVVNKTISINADINLLPSNPNKINTGSQTFSILFKETGTTHQYVSQTGNIDKIYWNPSRTTLGSATFLGTTPLIGTDILPCKIYLTASTTGTHSLSIKFNPLFNQSKATPMLISGTPSSIFVEFATQSTDMFWTAFNNIISPNSVYTYQGTFSNSSNITVVNSLAPTGFAGGGPSSTTFLM